ncbi:conjugal transfer protein TrbJ [Salmonella enterica subsp. enterica]|uniref:Conjugal transfer protein TrbJ n=1 Tax=Salmonella enterica I TaxID=59201 RepID=A0A379W2D0_SALET|nr:conjugal transfer protein TrbJ [Salmonella enterica subsp. enterica]
MKKAPCRRCHRGHALHRHRPCAMGRDRPTNLVQNTMTAIRTLEQINNQIRQLQNEAQMLMNQARNLASLPSSVVGQLRANLATTERLIAQARGLAYDVTNLDREFARLYPEQYAATVSGDQMYRDAQERWKNTLNGLQTTMQMQAQVSQNLGEDESVLADLVGKSQSAQGALQGDAGHESVARLAGQAVDPVAAAPDHARPGRLAGTGRAGGGHRARPRSAAALPRGRHAVHAAVRQLLRD